MYFRLSTSLCINSSTEGDELAEKIPFAQPAVHASWLAPLMAVARGRGTSFVVESKCNARFDVNSHFDGTIGCSRDGPPHRCYSQRS
jgi:hypothetical protein